jgi:hypothetical protein
VSLDRTDYQVGDKPKLEVTVQNNGPEPIDIPVSPHLADLQPEDPAQKFAYQELQITMWVAADNRWSVSSGPTALLYGAEDHPNTMITLHPGEWLRVIAQGEIRLEGDLIKFSRSGYPADHAYAEAALLREQTLITATQSATVATEVCVTKKHEQGVPIRLVLP